MCHFVFKEGERTTKWLHTQGRDSSVSFAHYHTSNNTWKNIHTLENTLEEKKNTNRWKVAKVPWLKRRRRRIENRHFPPPFIRFAYAFFVAFFSLFVLRVFVQWSLICRICRENKAKNEQRTRSRRKRRIEDLVGSVMNSLWSFARVGRGGWGRVN